MLKKVLLSITLASYLFVSLLAGGLTNTNLVPKTRAASGYWYDQGYFQWAEKVYDDTNTDEIFGERYTAAQVNWIIFAIVSFIPTQILGSDFVGCQAKLMNDFPPIPTAAEFAGCLAKLVTLDNQGSPLYASAQKEDNEAGKLGGFLSTGAPISGIAYVRSIGERLKIVPEAKAQTTGYGFGAVNFMLDFWKAVRNIAYFFLILIIIVMAFMIMFRVKISPQTVITVQSALPKVVITLLLITFSYAIAGFVVDLMYLVIGLMATLLIQGGVVERTIEWRDLYIQLTTGQSVFGIMFKYTLLFLIVFLWSFISNVAGAITAVVATVFTAGSAIPIILLIAVALVFIVMFYYAVKIAVMLVKNMLEILLLIVAGPLYILFGALGGPGFGGWLKNLAARLAVYPATGFLFVLAFLFLREPVTSDGNGELANFFNIHTANLWPFDVGNIISGGVWIPPFTGSNDLDFVWTIASLVVVGLIPKTAEMIKAAIQGRPFSYGTGLAELGGAAMMIGRPGGRFAAGKLGPGGTGLGFQIPSQFNLPGGRSVSVPSGLAGRQIKYQPSGRAQASIGKLNEYLKERKLW